MDERYQKLWDKWQEIASRMEGSSLDEQAEVIRVGTCLLNDWTESKKTMSKMGLSN